MSEATQATLGAMILNPDCIAEMAEKLELNMFTEQRDRQIWTALIALHDDSTAIDLLTLRDKIGKDIADVDYLVETAESPPHMKSVNDYADIVVEAHRTAEVARLAQDLTRISQGDGTASDKLVAVDKAVRERTEFETKDGARVMHVREIEVSFEEEDNKYLKTQFEALNAQIMGFGSTDLIGVLAATGMGKTSLMIDFLLHFGFHKEIPCAFFSCELTNHENMKRMCCNLADKNYVQITNGFCSAKDKDDLYQKAAEINMKPVFLNKTPGLTPSDLRRKLTSLHRREGIQVAFVDHLHNMEPDVERGSRRLNLSDMVRTIKNIAVDLEIPIVIGIQTNRNPSNDKRHAELYDAEECGAIEQNLDKCLSPYRPSRYKLEGPDQIYELKGRNCGTGPVEVEFFEQYSSFRPTEISDF